MDDEKKLQKFGTGAKALLPKGVPRLSASENYIISLTEATQIEKIIGKWKRELSAFIPEDSTWTQLQNWINNLQRDFTQIIGLLQNPEKTSRRWDSKFQAEASNLIHKSTHLTNSEMENLTIVETENNITKLNSWIKQLTITKETNPDLTQIQKLANDYGLPINTDKKRFGGGLIERNINEFLIENSANIEKEILNLPDHSWEKKFFKKYEETKKSLDGVVADNNVCDHENYVNIISLTKKNLRQLTYAALNTGAFTKGSDSYEKIAKPKIELLQEKIEEIFPNPSSTEDEVKAIEEFCEKIVLKGLKLFSFLFKVYEPPLRHKFLKSQKDFKKKHLSAFYWSGSILKRLSNPIVEICAFPHIFQCDDKGRKITFAKGDAYLNERKEKNPDKEKEIHQETKPIINNNNKTDNNYLPWIIGGSVLTAIVLGWATIVNLQKKKKTLKRND